MKTEIQTSAERIQLCQLIEHMHLAMLTTVNEIGALVSRPMAPLEMTTDGSIWFFTDLETAKVKQLKVLNLSFSDVDQGTYVSISGRGEISTDRAHINRLWTPMAKPWFPDGPDSPNLCLIKVIPEVAEYWDAPHGKMMRLVAMAASIVTGQPVGVGDHDVLSQLADGVPR